METRLVDAHGLIHASAELQEAGSYRGMWADVQRGLLVKLRRGVYVETAKWRELDPRQRHILRIRATAATATRPIAVAGLSAAALWGIPIGRDWPDEVTVIDRWKGGGRSEGGVQRTARDYSTARLVTVDGVECTSLERTALDLARVQPLADAVASVDWCLGAENPAQIGLEPLWAELGRLNRWAPRRRLEGVLRLATDRSGSFGESRARVVMFQLGFADPVLQQEFRDDRGSLFVDFFWPRASVVVEFDGKMKYTEDRYTSGDPAAVVWREKQRQDRLQRLVRRVERITTADVERPEQLALILSAAGVPRA